MATVICGAHGVRWRGADWIVRNAFELLIAHLRRAGDDALAERCRTIVASGAQLVDLSELLETDAAAAAWRNAVDAAVQSAQNEPATQWNEPFRKTGFVAQLRMLQTLAVGGGNAFVVDLAQKTRRRP